MKDLKIAAIRMALAGIVFLLMMFLPERGFFTGKVYSATIFLLIILMAIVTPYRILFRHVLSLTRGKQIKKQ